MKKILSLLLVVALLLSLGACTRRPATTPEADDPQSNISSTEPDSSKTPAEPDNSPAQDPQPAETPAQDSQPAETPAQNTDPEPSEEPVESPEPSEEPEESPEPSEEPAESPEPSDKPTENPNEGKVDSSATVTSTATDLAPAPGDDGFLSLVPELPYENWASTNIDADTIMLELSGLGADAQAKLLEYIQTLRDEEFEVTEYIYGSLYEASNDKAIITMMLDGGTFSITIEKK